jgi:hypothetical protein
MISRHSAAACAVFVSFCVAAHGAIVTDSYSQPFGVTPVGTPSFNVTLPKFDPALGTLLSVALTLDTTTAGGSLSFDNEAVVGGTVELEFKISITASAGAGPVLSVATTPIASGTSSVTGDADALPDFGGGDAFSITGGGTNSASTSQTLPSFLTQFTGAGETFLAVIANTINTKANTAGMFGPTLPNGGTFLGTVTVAYTYLTPIPEAGTALWGACLASMVAFRRPRVRRA